jgi:hypothetical protein
MKEQAGVNRRCAAAAAAAIRPLAVGCSGLVGLRETMERQVKSSTSLYSAV